MGKVKMVMFISFIGMMVLSIRNNTHAAGNTPVTNYQFNNTASTGSSTYRRKYNSSDAYIHPKSGLTIYYTVHGNNSMSGAGYNCSAMVSVAAGQTLYMSNSVYANGYEYAKLKFDRYIGSPVNINTSGQWSPDTE